VRLLLDSNALIWAYERPSELSPAARAAIGETANERFVSMASLWEIAIKIKTGKLNTIGSSVAYLRDEMEAYGISLLPIRYEHILQLESLPHHHSDPFDRLLIAQALTESLPILSGDRAFANYGIKLVW